MKGELCARNEENENKLLLPSQRQMLATLVNNPCPCGGNMQSPQRLHSGRSPPAHPRSLLWGWMRSEFSST